MSALFRERIDHSHHRVALTSRGFTQIRDVLQRDVLARIHQALEHETPWQFVMNHKGKHHDIHPAQHEILNAAAKSAISASIADGGATGFQYAYDSFPLSDHATNGTLTSLNWRGVHDFMTGEPFAAFARDVTGDDRIVHADVQLTRYRPGHFLTTHDDLDEQKGRLYAYVLGLTPVWKPEFGGLLLLHNGDGDIEAGFTPRLNAMNVFRVPRPHSVSQVASFAPSARFSMTGWLRSK